MDENLWQQTQGLRTIGFGWHDIIRKISNKVIKYQSCARHGRGIMEWLFSWSLALKCHKHCRSFFHRTTEERERKHNIKLWYFRVLLVGFSLPHFSFVFKYDKTSQFGGSEWIEFEEFEISSSSLPPSAAHSPVLHWFWNSRKSPLIKT